VVLLALRSGNETKLSLPWAPPYGLQTLLHTYIVCVYFFTSGWELLKHVSRRVHISRALDRWCLRVYSQFAFQYPYPLYIHHGFCSPCPHAYRCPALAQQSYEGRNLVAPIHTGKYLSLVDSDNVWSFNLLAHADY
jgi:hypothetical protein